ncbi:hypothetical protein AB0C52_28725 [Streptomyces sp. NPDC048717]|uniref:hypothetical protein n=1 Tax=Streptomyces sp. NPDC048717 TaxID=3154928 RepID=UPI00342CE390
MNPTEPAAGPKSTTPDGRTALGEAACRHQAEGIPAEDLPMIAAEALAAGADTPALRELAGLPRRADPRDIRDVFEQALREAGIGLPEPGLARRHALRRAAARLVAGAIEPVDLATQEWAEIEGETAEERAFTALIPPCDCCFAYTLGTDRRVWEARLHSSALALTSTPPIGPGC